MTGYYQKQRRKFLPTKLQFLPTKLQRRFFKVLINNGLRGVFPAYNLVNIMN